MKEFFDMIKKDHKEVQGIFQKLRESSKSAVKTREKMFNQLKEELLPHLKAEESTLYPALKEQKESRLSALEAMEEHRLSEMVFKEMESLPKDDDMWSAKLKVLKDMVEHHIEEEEEQIFKMAEETLEVEQMEDIMQAFQDEKERVKEQIS